MDAFINLSLLNRYRIDARIGAGGMGVVYRAHDSLLKRDVAVKVISESSLGSGGRARLLAEAQAAAGMNHPNIVTIHDVGETDGKPFIIMEYVRGKTLRGVQPKNYEEFRLIARQIGQALEHAHRHGVIHRDLKPENIMLVNEDPARLKLMDFGLAVTPGMLEDASGASEMDRPLVGTPAYLAPEVLQGRPADERTDLYALGMVLYELAVGRLPFQTENIGQLLVQALYEAPALPSAYRPDFPLDLEALILKLLEKEPDLRPPSAASVLEALGSAYATPTPRPAAVIRHNLPPQLTSFVGRAKERQAIQAALDSARLVTLTGSGGVGKTRLAIQAGQDFLDCYWGGVWLVELASLGDPDLVVQTVCGVLGVRLEAGRLPLETLCDHLRERDCLLILDNCEHLIGACASLAEILLRQCPVVHILTTSREPLGIPGEASVRVPSLSLPDGRQLPPLEQLNEYDAVRLFSARAAAAHPGFALNTANAAHVVQICQRLDGIPLAIELAAARVQVLSVEQIARRLDDRFRLLTGGSRTALPRQQTLRALIDWSYDLLSEPERRILQRLAVFAGGWTLEAAESVSSDCCGETAAGIDFLEALTLLVNKSLVVVVERPQGQEGRYRLLETIRQYVREKLFESGQALAIRQAHFDYYLGLARQAETALAGAEQYTWFLRLDDELDNLRQALEWSLDNDPLHGLEMALCLHEYWDEWGEIADAADWLERLLACPENAADSLPRALGLVRLGHYNAGCGRPQPLETIHAGLEMARRLDNERVLGLALFHYGFAQALLGDMEAGARYVEESLTIFRRLNQPLRMAECLQIIGGVLSNSDYGRSRAALEEALAIHRQANTPAFIIDDLTFLSQQANRHRDFVLSRDCLRAAADLLNVVQRPEVISYTYYHLAQLELAEGSSREALAHMETVVNTLRATGRKLLMNWALSKLAYCALANNEHPRARLIFHDCLEAFQKMGIRIGVVYSIEGLCQILTQERQAALACALFAWADQVRQALSDARPPIEQRDVDAALAAIAGMLSPEEQQAAQLRGQALDEAGAISLAVAAG